MRSKLRNLNPKIPRRLAWPELASHPFVCGRGETCCIAANGQLPAPRESIAQQFTDIARRVSIYKNDESYISLHKNDESYIYLKITSHTIL